MRIDSLNPADLAAAAPAAAKAATPTVDPELHDAALKFEELLVRQLTSVLAESAKGSDDEEGGGDSTTSFYADQLPAALASSIKDAGGLGLATELERAMGSSS